MSGGVEPGVRDLLAREMFELAPFGVSVIDREFRIVAANSNFEDHFGEWRGRKCYEAYKNLSQPCPRCEILDTFEDGRVTVSDEAGVDRQGRSCHYVVHRAPLRGSDGRVDHVIEMTTDLTETRRWRRQYELLFERVPCYVLVIDREFRIVRANEAFRADFGETDDRRCFEVCKRRTKPCSSCPAMRTFEDGSAHVSNQVGIHKDGSPAYYQVTTAPLSRGDSGVAHVIEMAIDVTRVRELEEKLARERDLYESLIRNSATGILALDRGGGVRIMNPAAREVLGWTSGRRPSKIQLKRMLPPEFFSASAEEGTEQFPPEVSVCAASGEQIPARISSVPLKSGRKTLGRAAFIQDLREVKKLEHEKLEAERLGAVGQTVAGLAHTIKNLLMGLEGGMYMVDSGLRKGDATRIAEGWEILQRNFAKTTTLVKDFLGFAKGRLPELRAEDPAAIARGVVELYRDAAARQGVELVLDNSESVRQAPLDAGGIEACLTNLLSNGIDAAMMRDRPGAQVIVRTREEGEDLVFEVSDNGCGMDQDIKAKVFTTFFTTKGGRGAGLGLLTTRKIVQEHGGRVEMESLLGKGSMFRIRLPRARLESLAAESQKKNGMAS
jgi:PAS domain S-box-containing protein